MPWACRQMEQPEITGALRMDLLLPIARREDEPAKVDCTMARLFHASSQFEPELGFSLRKSGEVIVIGQDWWEIVSEGDPGFVSRLDNTMRYGWVEKPMIDPDFLGFIHRQIICNSIDRELMLVKCKQGLVYFAEILPPVKTEPAPEATPTEAQPSLALPDRVLIECSASPNGKHGPKGRSVSLSSGGSTPYSARFCRHCNALIVDRSPLFGSTQ